MKFDRMLAALASMDQMDEAEQEEFAQATELFSAIYALGYAAGTAAKAETEKGAQA